MTERSRAVVRTDGRTFLPRSIVLNADDLRRALTRIAHEIVERNHGADVVVVGLQTGGARFASRLAELLSEITGTTVPLGLLDVARFRDDLTLRPVHASATEMPADLTGRTVVLVDDVLFTGRTVRAALDALAQFGRARTVQLAVMVDRGHRELPIRPDYVGKNLPTRHDEVVEVTDESVMIGELEEKGSGWNTPA